MRCLVIYDIPDDRARAKVADFCQDYGLSRVQYSAFVGDISRSRQDELLQKIRRRLGRLAARVVLFPLCETDFRTRREVAVP
jgi:CRISPR-associated protein Cas2